jgi:hypothetical protein
LHATDKKKHCYFNFDLGNMIFSKKIHSFIKEVQNYIRRYIFSMENRQIYIVLVRSLPFLKVPSKEKNSSHNNSLVECPYTFQSLNIKKKITSWKYDTYSTYFLLEKI